MKKWMNEWTNEWMNEWVSKWVSEQTAEWLYEWDKCCIDIQVNIELIKELVSWIEYSILISHSKF